MPFEPALQSRKCNKPWFVTPTVLSNTISKYLVLVYDIKTRNQTPNSNYHNYMYHWIPRSTIFGGPLKTTIECTIGFRKVRFVEGPLKSYFGKSNSTFNYDFQGSSKTVLWEIQWHIQLCPCVSLQPWDIIQNYATNNDKLKIQYSTKIIQIKTKPILNEAPKIKTSLPNHCPTGLQLPRNNGDDDDDGDG